MVRTGASGRASGGTTGSAAGQVTRTVVQRRYGGPHVLSLTSCSRPVPGPGEVLVSVEAASVNARDWHVMRGEPRLARLLDRSLFSLRRPRTPVRGTDLAGTVEAVGAGVTRWQPGDAVFGEGRGTFADHAVARADQLAAVPAGTTWAEAAALPLAAVTALQCLQAATAHAGESVLVIGAAGGVGTFALQIARAMGLHVTAVVSSRKVALARSLGADAVVDYTAQDVLALDRRYDVVLDLVGTHGLRLLRTLVRDGGATVLSGGGVSGSGSTVGAMRLLTWAQVRGRLGASRIVVPQARPTTELLESVSDLVITGSVRPVIDRRFDLTEVAAALEYVERVHPAGKVVIGTT